MTLEQLKQRLLDGYDPDDLVNELEISSEEILRKFSDVVEKYWIDNYGEEEVNNDAE